MVFVNHLSDGTQPRSEVSALVRSRATQGSRLLGSEVALAARALGRTQTQRQSQAHAIVQLNLPCILNVRDYCTVGRRRSLRDPETEKATGPTFIVVCLQSRLVSP